MGVCDERVARGFARKLTMPKQEATKEVREKYKLLQKEKSRLGRLVRLHVGCCRLQEGDALPGLQPGRRQLRDLR